MTSKKPSHALAKSVTLSALALGLGIKHAHALDIEIVNMLFGSSFRATGNINFDQQTGSFTSIDPFYSANWTADVVETFTTPGAHVWTDNGGPVNAINDNIPIGNYSYPFTLQPGQVAAGVFFDWNGNYDIPVLTIFDCGNPDNGCRAAGPGDASGGNIGGVPMQTPPFQGQAPAFNDGTGGTSGSGATVPGAPPLRLAANVPNLNASLGVQASWQPSLLGTVATPTCTIVQQPASGTATVQSNCSSGTFTSSAAGSDSFIYQVSTSGGTDTGTVSVTVSAGNAPPNAADDTASTSVSTPVDIDVLANDSASSGALVPSSVTITQDPSQGAASVNTANGVITYTPNTGYCGPDGLNYTVDDTNGATSSPATVLIGVDADNLCSPNNVIISPGSIDPGGDGQVTLSQLLSAGIPADSGVTQQCVGGCFDYQVTGLTGPTATLVYPLTASIPAAPLMRKWTGAAWVDFVTGPNDSVASAGRVGGLCPSVGYSTGLTTGNTCVRVTISDGGPNDMDGEVNGEIVDPTGVGRENIPAANSPLGSASGCTISPPGDTAWRRFDWAVLLGFVSWLGLRRKTRGVKKTG